MLTYDIISFEQLGPALLYKMVRTCHFLNIPGVIDCISGYVKREDPDDQTMHTIFPQI